MAKIPGTDIWVLQLRMEDWDHAFFSYSFYSPSGGAFPGELKYDAWRGRLAPELPVASKHLSGRLHEYSLPSQYLSEVRRITVYLPPGRVTLAEIPVIFMSDGESCEDLAKVIEPLILERKIRPVAIIGVHSAKYRGDESKPLNISLDFRSKEYIPGFDDQRFQQHMDFFTKEVMNWAIKTLGISPLRRDHLIFGSSNGASFAASAAAMHPELFQYALPFSLGMPPAEMTEKALAPQYLFVAGTLDKFSESTQEASDEVKSHGADSTLKLYVSGHDPLLWKVALLDSLRQLFPGHKRT